MQGLYDYYKGILAPAFEEGFYEALLANGTEPLTWPCPVINVNDQVIGSAIDKQDYINQWNSDAANQAIGMLSGWYGPFGFWLIKNKESDGSGNNSNSSEVFKLIYPSDGSNEITVTLPVLKNKELLFAMRGSMALDIITSGVPAATEILFNALTGTLTWTDPLSVTDGYPEKLRLLYK